MASVAYAIEGSKESIESIQKAVLEGLNDKKHWTEYAACKSLGFTDEELDDKRLGGELYDPEISEQGVLKLYGEERWGLQDFEKLLRHKFPDITVYWSVEESGCAVYCTNDKEGKYFPERYYADVCIDGNYYSEYFPTEKALFEWLAKLTNNRVKSVEDIENFNADYEDSGNDDENFINVYEYDLSNE